MMIANILEGCAFGSFSSYISDSSVEYNATIEAATNIDLVANILRTHEQEPLYFSDLSQIRDTVQLQIPAQVSAPLGLRPFPMCEKLAYLRHTRYEKNVGLRSCRRMPSPLFTA
jgi:hypothetical protein